MGVSQCQTVLMCLSSSHPWRGTPVGQVQALTAKNPPSYNIQGMLLSAVTNDGAGNTFNLVWPEYLQVFNNAVCFIYGCNPATSMKLLTRKGKLLTEDSQPYRTHTLCTAMHMFDFGAFKSLSTHHSSLMARVSSPPVVQAPRSLAATWLPSPQTPLSIAACFLFSLLMEEVM